MLSLLAIAVLPSGWTRLKLASRRRVPVAEIRILVRKKRIYLKEKRLLRYVTFLTLVHVENFLVERCMWAVNLSKKPRNQIFQQRKPKNWLKLTSPYGLQLLNRFCKTPSSHPLTWMKSEIVIISRKLEVTVMKRNFGWYITNGWVEFTACDLNYQNH